MLKARIKKRLGQFVLDVSFQAQTQVLALFGPSGAGKSLTLQCIAGLLTPDDGRIEIGPRVAFDAARGINLRPQQRRVGYVFQNYALFPHLSVARNIAFGLPHLPPAERRQRVAEALRAMRLEGLESRLPRELSGGQQQRVALARTLVTEPAILLLDEPFAALDSVIRGRLQRELLQLLSDLAIPTVLVTHNLDEAYSLAGQIAVYDNGRVLQCEPRDDVYYRPQSKAVARFVGMKNFGRGRITAVEAEHLRLESFGLEFFAPARPRADGAAWQPGDTAQWCIRPEHVMLVRKDRPFAPLTPGETRLPGKVVQEVAHGSHYTLLFRPEGAGALPDLHVTLPTYMYHRLRLDTEKHWWVSLKQGFIHLLPDA